MSENQRVLYAFLDESYTDAAYYMAAAIAPDDVWSEIADSLAEIRRETVRLHGIDDNAEFHAWEIMGGARGWGPLRGRHREAAGVYHAALRTAREAGVRFTLAGVDIQRLNARFKYPDHPYSVVLQRTLKHVNDHAVALGEREPVEIMIDQAEDEDQHEALMIDHVADGSLYGHRPDNYPMLSPHLNFVESRHSPGLQVADLAVYLHRRRSVHVETSTAALRSRRSLEAQLDPAVVTREFWRP